MGAQVGRVEALVEEIRKRTEEEASRIIAEARRRAEQIIKEAEREVERLVEHEARPRAMVLRRRILGSAELRGRAEVLKAKEEVIRKIAERARARLEAVAAGKESSVDYREVLYDLLREAVEKLGEPSAVVYANERDRRYLAENLSSIESKLEGDLGREVKLALGDRVLDCLGGVVVESPDGSKVYYNTLEGRLEEALRRSRGWLGRVFKELVGEVGA